MRVAAAVSLCGIAIAGPAATWQTTQGEGAFVGVSLLAILCLALAFVVAPWTTHSSEARHHELQAIWREIRADADDEVPWVRYGAWAVADGETVRLELVCCTRATSDTPSLYRRGPAGEVDGEDPAAALAAMEALRGRAASMEEAARQAYLQSQQHERDLREDQALQAVERQAAEYQEHNEQQLRAEIAAQERAERRARAVALARALRRP